MRKLVTAWLTTNRNCNNQCSYCYAKNTWHNSCMMDFEKVKEAVDRLCENGIKRIVLIGGEPTLYPHFFQTVEYIRNKGIPVYIPSNGRIFSNHDFSKKMADVGISGIDISLKAVDEESYKQGTGVNGFRQMLDGYHNLKELGINVTASYVITKYDEVEFDKLIELAERESISPMMIQFVKPTLDLNQKVPIMSILDMGKSVGYIYNHIRDKAINYKFEVSFPICTIERSVFDELVKLGRVVNCCQVPRGTGINFDETFKVIPCNHFADFPLSDKPVDMENFDEEVDAILESDLAKKVRELSSSYPTVKCQTCKDWYICGGGCFTRWLSADPNGYIK